MYLNVAISTSIVIPEPISFPFTNNEQYCQSTNNPFLLHILLKLSPIWFQNILENEWSFTFIILLILKVRSSSTFRQYASMYIAPYLREYAMLLMLQVITAPLRVQYSIFIVCCNTTALCITSSIVIAYVYIEWIIIRRRRKGHRI